MRNLLLPVVYLAIFALGIFLLRSKMDYLSIAVSIVTIIGSVFAGVWWIVSKTMSIGMDKQHLVEFEKETHCNFLAINSRLDKIEKDLTEQKVTIARLEEKIDNLQVSKK